MIQREKRTGKILIRAFLGFDYSFFSLRCSSSALKTTRAPSAFFVFFFLFFFVPRTLSLIFVGKENFLTAKNSSSIVSEFLPKTTLATYLLDRSLLRRGGLLKRGVDL